MQLQVQIDIVADGLANAPHVADGVAHLGDVGLEVELGGVLVEERVEVAQRREPGLLLQPAFLDDGLDGLAVDVGVDARLRPRRPA